MKVSSKIVIVTGILMSLTMSVFANQEVDVYEPKIEQVVDLGEDGIIEISEAQPISEEDVKNEVKALYEFKEIVKVLREATKGEWIGFTESRYMTTPYYWYGKSTGKNITLYNKSNRDITFQYRRMVGTERTSLSDKTLITVKVPAFGQKTIHHKAAETSNWRYYVMVSPQTPHDLSYTVKLN